MYGELLGILLFVFSFALLRLIQRSKLFIKTRESIKRYFDNLYYRIRFRILDSIGERAIDTNNTGNGNFTEENGWNVGKKFYYCDPKRK